MNVIRIVQSVLMLSVIPVIQGPHAYQSCKDIYRSNIYSQSGVYTILTSMDETSEYYQIYQVYCEFHKGYGYTFVAANTSAVINIDKLYTSSDHVLVRFLHNNHAQTQTKVEEISTFKSRYQLSLQYFKHDGYAAPLNANLGPYLYLGFLPVSEASHTGGTQGYRANGVDYTFINCDGSPNSYIAFIFNPNNRSHNDYHKTCCNTPLMNHIVDSATPATYNIPEYFYSYFEMHMGGCGGYGVPEEFAYVKASALGMRFDVTCDPLPPVPNTTQIGSETAFGSVIRYTCNSGILLSGNLERKCVETGEYTGLPPVCGNFEPCASNICENGGYCWAVDHNMYVCLCPSHFHGIACELS